MKRFVASLWLMLCTILLSSANALADEPPGEFVREADLTTQTALGATDLGVWHGILDGAPGEGSLFYRLEFNSDGTVAVLKQFAGNNVREIKNWTLSGDRLEINSTDHDEIRDFEGASLDRVNANTIHYQNGDRSFVLTSWNQSSTLIHFALVLLVLMALNELFRRSKRSAIVFFFVLPIVLLPIWLSHDVTYWFKWVKLYSVVFGCVWFTLIRYTKLGEMKFALFGAAAFLALNIAEAVNQDFSMGYLPNMLNAIAGILSIVTLAGWKHIHADSSKEKDMVWPAMTIFWIIAYDIWNFAFVYLNFPGSAATQFLVLLACTIPSLFIKRGTWLQARAFTLAAWFMYYFTFPRFVESQSIALPRNDDLMLAIAILSIAANGVYAIIHFRRKFAAKRQAGLPVEPDPNLNAGLSDRSITELR